MRKTQVSQGRIRHDGAVTIRPLNSEQTMTSEETLTTNYRKAALSSLISGAPRWLGSCPKTSHGPF